MSPVLAPLAALFSALTWGVGSHLFGRLLRGASVELRPTAAAANLFKNLLAALVFCVVWAATGGALPEPAAAGWIGWSGFIGFAIGDTLYFAAIARCGVQVAAMVTQLNVPFAALLSWLFLGEALPPVALVSMLVVLVGVSLVVLDRAPGTAAVRDPNARRSGALLALLCAITQATAVVSGHSGMDGVAIVPGSVVRMLGAVLGAFVVALCMGAASGLAGARSSPAREVRDLVRPLHTRAMWKPLAAAALFGSVLGLLPYHLALRDLPGGIAAVLFATTPLFTLPLGLLFGERHGLRAVLGTSIGFAGVIGIVSSLGQ